MNSVRHVTKFLEALSDDGEENEAADRHADECTSGAEEEDRSHLEPAAEAQSSACSADAGGEIGDRMEEQGGEEEAAKAKIYPMPGEPTPRERQIHDATHLPFRSWCRFCIRGCGRNTAHETERRKEERTEEEDAKIPRFSMDHFYIKR